MGPRRWSGGWRQRIGAGSVSQPFACAATCLERNLANAQGNMNRLSADGRSRVLACLVEGNSIRSTVRITGICKRTVSWLLMELGDACQKFANERLTGLHCKTLQCDEIWSFVGCKAKNSTLEKRMQGQGDAWPGIAMEVETKLVAAWHTADRTALSAYRFMRQLEPRLADRVQLTTDGHHAYLVAVKAAFISRGIDYGMLVKIYEQGETGRYSPANCIGAKRVRIMGQPDSARISTSIAERNNLTIRMQMRRFTRLTNAFSKSLAAHKAALAIHFVHYNFCRIHSTIRVTPAMSAGLTNRVWELTELIALLDPPQTAQIAA
jgi:IS1 family transposase